MSVTDTGIGESSTIELRSYELATNKNYQLLQQLTLIDIYASLNWPSYSQVKLNNNLKANSLMKPQVGVESRHTDAKCNWSCIHSISCVPYGAVLKIHPECDSQTWTQFNTLWTCSPQEKQHRTFGNITLLVIQSRESQVGPQILQGNLTAASSLTPSISGYTVAWSNTKQLKEPYTPSFT